MSIQYEFKNIPNFEDYAINQKGELLSLKNNKQKLLVPQMGNAGYLYITLCKNNIRHNRFIHRLIAITFIENPLNKEQVNHIDGNKLNNHISNLEWITPSENILHAIKNNLIKRSFKQNEMLGIRSRKKCIDVKTNIIYDSLKEACDKNNLKYSCELNKIQRKANTIRFLYL
jgi:hypothetical protein